MIEVFLHDVEAGTAVIQVVSGGTTLTDTYDLSMVFPGTKQVLETLGIPFDEAAQLKAIAYVGEQMERMMETGAFPGDPVYVPKEELDPPEPGETEFVAPAQVEPKPPVAKTKSAVPMKPVKAEENIMPGPAPAIDKSKAPVYEAPKAPPPPKPERPIPVVEDTFIPPVPDEIKED